MNQLLEWAPLIVFFVVFKLLGIYWATAALMLACVLLLVVHRLRTGKFKTMHIITAGVLGVLGSATLLLHDRRFIQWKPTVLLSLAAVAFLGSMVLGKQPLARRLFERVFEQSLKVSSRQWLWLNTAWIAWFAALGVANIYVARHFAESTWVNFKVFGISAAMLIFMVPQVLWLSSKTTPAGQGVKPDDQRVTTDDRGAPSRAHRLRERLQTGFAPNELEIEDDSHLHVGHAGAAGGQSHFRVRIVAEAFRGLSALASHRLVYAAVGDLLETDIHALAIKASAPDHASIIGEIAR